MRGFWGVTILVACVSTRAFADPAEGTRHFNLAQAHYDASRYDAAIAELEAAHTTDPQPEYLWAIAQAYRAKGDCKRAIVGYGAYLRTGPTPAATRMTQRSIDRCTTELAAQPPDAPPPAPSPPVEPLVIREVQRVHLRDVTIPWYRDRWGDGLVIAGVMCLAVGGIELAVANRHDDNATGRTTYGGFDSELRARDRAETIGTVVLVGGGALVVGGLVRYALRPKKIRTEVRVDPVTRTASASMAWSFP